MFVYRTRGVVATLGALALIAACTDPKQRTDLRPEGPPEVLTVMIATDAANGQLETATYCALNDPYRPGLVGTPDGAVHQICEEDLTKPAPEVTNAAPDGWFVRIMFDELLNPDIEEITQVLDANMQPTGTYVGSIANTKPVKLECMSSTGGGLVEVQYDGYYSPSGNKVTWPLGPSLVIKPARNPIVPTNTDCQVTIKDNVLDKDGNQVPANERGPYKFKIAPIQVLTVSPADKEMVDPLAIYSDNMYVQFNTAVNPMSFCDDDGNAAGFGFPPGFGAVCSTAPTALPIRFDIGPHPAGPGGKWGVCAVTGAPCTTTAADCTGGAADTCDFFYAYSLQPFGFTPQEFGFGPQNAVEADKDYAFSFVQGTSIKDKCGSKTTFGAPSITDLTLVHFHTNKFALNGITPATGDLVAPNKKIDMAFSNVLDLTTLTPAEYSITPAPTLAPSAATCVDGGLNNNPCDAVNGACAPGVCAGAECTAGACYVRFRTNTGGDVQFRGHFALDTQYTFTYKAGAKVSDVYGVEATNGAMDRTFTWKTQPAIKITASAPKDKAVLGKATGTSTSTISFNFNQGMVPSSLDASDYTISPAVALNPTATPAGSARASTVGSLNCSASSTGCQLQLKAVFPPGDYTFTLKAGAMLTDAIGNTYTQAADKVIHFTVKDAPPPATPCL